MESLAPPQDRSHQASNKLSANGFAVTVLAMLRARRLGNGESSQVKPVVALDQ